MSDQDVSFTLTAIDRMSTVVDNIRAHLQQLEQQLKNVQQVDVGAAGTRFQDATTGRFVSSADRSAMGQEYRDTLDQAVSAQHELESLQQAAAAAAATSSVAQVESIGKVTAAAKVHGAVIKSNLDQVLQLGRTLDPLNLEQLSLFRNSAEEMRGWLPAVGGTAAQMRTLETSIASVESRAAAVGSTFGALSTTFTGRLLASSQSWITSFEGGSPASGRACKASARRSSPCRRSLRGSRGVPSSRI